VLLEKLLDFRSLEERADTWQIASRVGHGFGGGVVVGGFVGGVVVDRSVVGGGGAGTV
jgi:hypothetical protein